jgi:hypothetical protein
LGNVIEPAARRRHGGQHQQLVADQEPAAPLAGPGQVQIDRQVVDAHVHHRDASLLNWAPDCHVFHDWHFTPLRKDRRYSTCIQLLTPGKTRGGLAALENPLSLCGDTPPKTTIGIQYLEVAMPNLHAEGVIARQAELMPEIPPRFKIFTPKA